MRNRLKVIWEWWSSTLLWMQGMAVILPFLSSLFKFDPEVLIIQYPTPNGLVQTWGINSWLNVHFSFIFIGSYNFNLHPISQHQPFTLHLAAARLQGRRVWVAWRPGKNDGRRPGSQRDIKLTRYQISFKGECKRNVLRYYHYYFMATNKGAKDEILGRLRTNNVMLLFFPTHRDSFDFFNGKVQF